MRASCLHGYLSAEAILFYIGGEKNLIARGAVVAGRERRAAGML
jgi:hypothetical protein